MSLLDLVGIGIAKADTVAPAAAQHPGGMLSALWLPLLLIVVFYFLLIRPQNKRAKEHKALMDNLTIGDEVLTAGGIVARITRLKDQFVVLEVSKDIHITLQKSSIASILPKGTIDSV